VATEYAKLYVDGKKEISINLQKCRVYARFHGDLPEPHFNHGQRILDSAFSLLNAMHVSHIDYLLDLRFGLPFSDTVFELWKNKAFELLTKYPRLNPVRISDEDSPLWLQISTIQELLNQYEGRVIGVFKTKEEADAYLDKLRGYTSA
jgi:hypothetical protein